MQGGILMGVYSVILLLDRPWKEGELSLPDTDNISGISFPLPYFFVGDAAFPLKTYMLRPYLGRYLLESKRIFNYRLSRA